MTKPTTLTVTLDPTHVALLEEVANLLRGDLGRTDGGPSTLTDFLADLDARLTVLEQRPSDPGRGYLAAELREQNDRLTAQNAALRSEIAGRDALDVADQQYLALLTEIRDLLARAEKREARRAPGS